jgi:TusA-related sulfurtransferase
MPERKGDKGQDFVAEAQVDVTEAVCPLTFVKAKVALDDLEEGQILSIRLNDGEPVQNVPRSLKEDGHKVLRLLDNGDGTYQLLVRKGAD